MKPVAALAGSLRDLAPLYGFDKASYAGGIEGDRDLEDIAADFGVDVPWAKGR